MLSKVDLPRWPRKIIDILEEDYQLRELAIRRNKHFVCTGYFGQPSHDFRWNVACTPSDVNANRAALRMIKKELRKNNISLERANEFPIQFFSIHSLQRVTLSEALASWEAEIDPKL